MSEKFHNKKIPHLRSLAEKVAKHLQTKTNNFQTNSELRRHVYELQVHQIELEIQNEEILRSKSETDSLLEKYTDLYDFSPVGYLTVDRKGIILESNLTSAKILETERSRLTGHSFIDYLSFTDRQDFDYFLRRVFSSQDKEACEIVIPQKYTIPLYVQIEALKSRSDNECRLALIDINDRKKAEEFLLQTEKLQSLGVLAGGIAHDFNNILTVILGNVAMARAQKDGPGRLAVRLKSIEKASEKAKNLTMQLVTFANGGSPVKKEIEIEEVLRSALKKAQTGYSNKGLLNIAKNLLHVDGDAGQLSQVFHNLALNSFHRMEDNGHVEIAAENLEITPGSRKKVKICFKESGPIISKEHISKIFDPFFAMNLDGSGLGLAVCNSIVKKHNGEIQVASNRMGTTFSVILPASELQSSEPLESCSEIKFGSGRVLLMDDDAGIREVLKNLLKTLGYQVEATENGSDAVKLYLKRKMGGKSFDVVIFDLMVPGGMGGKEAFEELIKHDPKVKAIASSGYSFDPIMSDFQEYGFSAVLRKPYQIEELSHTLADLLESQQS